MYNKKPLLLMYVVDRDHDRVGKLFHYDYCKDVNVLDSNPAIPFIEAGYQASLLTITKTERECDSDDDCSYAELYTKTHQQREQDDEEPPWHGIQKYRELISKTFADRERDDEEDDLVGNQFECLKLKKHKVSAR